MWNYIYPIIIVTSANTLYNICAKSTPSDVNSFASLSITYICAAVLSVIMYFVTSFEGGSDYFGELTKINWTSFVLGIAIIALEYGYICVYRVGWKINSASLVSNILLAIVLIFVGLILYKEDLSVKQLLGAAICGVGLILING